MAAEDIDRLVRICKDFVRSMARTEGALTGMDEALTAKEMGEALEVVLVWIQETDELPPNSFTREVAREIIGQLSSIVMLKDYEGSTDYYIA